MNNNNFKRICLLAFKRFKAAVPNPKTRGVGYYVNAYGNRQRGSTGNMAFNASKIRFLSPFQAVIYVDDKIAPYVPYANEEWISPKWKGHKNPNQGWFDRAAEIVVKSYMSSLPGAELKRRGGKQ